MQEYYTFKEGAWTLVEPDAFPQPAHDAPSIKTVYVITWCLDCEDDIASEQMTGMLGELKAAVASVPEDAAIVIHLQELDQAAAQASWRGQPEPVQNLRDILKEDWVRQRFNVTDVDTSSWDSMYLLRGSLTLFDRRLAVKSVLRIILIPGSHATDVILVSVHLDGDEGTAGEVLTFANVVLEQHLTLQHDGHWMILKNQLRGKDVKGKGKVGESAVAIVAGVCGLSDDEGVEIPLRNKFKDVYLELGHEQGAEEGITWQEARCRLDKQAYFGGAIPRDIKRLGCDLREEKLHRVPLLRQCGLLVPYELERGIKVVKTE